MAGSHSSDLPVYARKAVLQSDNYRTDQLFQHQVSSVAKLAARTGVQRVYRLGEGFRVAFEGLAGVEEDRAVLGVVRFVAVVLGLHAFLLESGLQIL
jgi:hypothetical protein